MSARFPLASERRVRVCAGVRCALVGVSGWLADQGRENSIV
jgi:hypothetical protein